MLQVSLSLNAEVEGASTTLCITKLINITKCLLYLDLFCGNYNLRYTIMVDVERVIISLF